MSPIFDIFHRISTKASVHIYGQQHYVEIRDKYEDDSKKYIIKK